MSKTREKRKDHWRRLAKHFKRQYLPGGELWRADVPNPKLKRS